MTLRQVTVFGGSGFVGRHIVRGLARQGVRVRAAVRRPELADFLKPMGDVGQVVPVQANVRNQESVAAAVAGSDGVVNATGIQFQRGRQRFESVHVVGAHNIAQAAAYAGIERLVHISGLGVDDPDSPSAFIRSKTEAEKAVREALPGATILRPSIIFGPEDKFFNNLATIARMAPFMPAIGGDHTSFQPVYVADVAAAAVRSLNDPFMAGSVFELGGPRVYTMRELAALVLAVTGRSQPIVNVPFALAKLIGLAAQMVPLFTPPLTFDQAYLLEKDSVVTPGARDFNEFGIEPAAAEVILPTYLDRFRVGGRYSTHAV